jgi:hypothetical protein
MMKTRILSFLDRDDASETWVYERRVILLVELICLLAVMVASPWGLPTYLLLVRAPLQLRKAASDHAARSGAARRREREEAEGRDPVRLACARKLEHEAWSGQVITIANPIVDLAAVWALSGGRSIAVVAIVGATCSLIRFGMVEGYGAWRRWYVREQGFRRDDLAEARDASFIGTTKVQRSPVRVAMGSRRYPWKAGSR